MTSLLEHTGNLFAFVLVLASFFVIFTSMKQLKLARKQLHDQSELINSIEISKNEALITQRHQKERLELMGVELDQLKELSKRQASDLHQAQREGDISATEIKQISQRYQDLESRLNQSSQDLSNLREQLQLQQAKYAELDKQSRAIEVKAEESIQKLNEKVLQYKSLEEKYEVKLEEFNKLSTAYTQLKTELEERQVSHQKQIAQFEEQKKALAEHFKLLANDILDNKTKALQETNQQSLSLVMNPFKESIESFKKQIEENHHREAAQQGELKKELASLKELNQKITTEAHELSTALKGQKKLQGNWGELVLENVLDRSGLQLGKDYKREVSITTEEGRQRPDAIVYLPQDKHLIIDAKVSLNAYTRYINSEDENERKQALAEHVNVMGQRINELANRDYYKLPGLNSPEIVFMFIPIESAFVEALKADETLFQKAIENNVLVATPTTLLTSLNIVRQLWRYEDQNKHTVALATKAETVFKKLNAFLASFENIKKGLDKANEAYVKAEGQLISGKGNLVKQVGEFKNLAPAIKAELPSYFTEKAELEIDYIAAEELPAEDEAV